MSEDDLKPALCQYKEQLSMIEEALNTTEDDEVRNSLLSLQVDLKNLIELTQESLDALSVKNSTATSTNQICTEGAEKNELDDEYALFRQEMANSGAYEENNGQKPEGSRENKAEDENSNSDIEDELSSLQGMKCAVYHMHKWGGQPTLYNAMVSSIVPRQDDDQFKDLQVRVLYTHPTHTEMLPCPFFLNGDCRFDDEQCRYSHGAVVQLSSLKEAIEPDFESVKLGSRVLVKLKPPDDEDISLARKSTEKYHLWHRALVKNIDTEKRTCTLKLEHGLKTGEKRKSGTDEFTVAFEEIFPLSNEDTSDSDSDSSISDTEYPTAHAGSSVDTNRALIIEKSLQTNGPALGEWERHTRGIGSKLMLAMGYIPGSGLGAASDGRLQPVEARQVPVGKSLDHCMELSERAADRDPLKVEQKLKRMQNREEERNKRAYEREKERERRNVFNFLNRTLGDKSDEAESSTSASTSDIKQTTNKDLNIEQFKITEETKRLEREIVKLNGSLQRQVPGSSVLKNLNIQIAEKNKELDLLKGKEQKIVNEQRQRKDKQKMTVF